MKIKNEISSLILFFFVDIPITYNAKNGVKENYVSHTLYLYRSSSVDINNTITQKYRYIFHL